MIRDAYKQFPFLWRRCGQICKQLANTLSFIYKSLTILIQYRCLQLYHAHLFGFLGGRCKCTLEAEGVKRLAWNMDILCRDFKDAVEWYPEHEPPKDTDETKERINRVTYGAVWRAMPALRTGEARKEQYGEEWWQWMSSSWNQRIPYATLGIKTGEEYARREGESWEEYQKRMSKMFAGVEFVAKVSPAALPMLQQQMGNLALTFDGPVGLIKGTESSMTMQNNRTFKLKDLVSYPGWLSMGESLMEAVAGMNPEDLGPWQAIKIDKVNIASLSSKDIMKRNPDAIAAYTALQSLTGNMDGGPTIRFNEDGQLVEFATGQLVNFNDDPEEGNSEDQPIPSHTPEQVQQRLIEMQTTAGNLLYQQTGIKSIILYGDIVQMHQTGPLSVWTSTWRPSLGRSTCVCHRRSQECN